MHNILLFTGLTLCHLHKTNFFLRLITSSITSTGLTDSYQRQPHSYIINIQQALE